MTDGGGVRFWSGVRASDEDGKFSEQVVRGRLTVLEHHPDIADAYYAAVGDPVQANGLLTSDVTDMGGVLVLRAQRLVFQQWLRDVPWAQAGR